MNDAVPGSLVRVTTTTHHHLPDPGDEHVLNAAISAGASVLLTFNLTDFPETALPEEQKVVHPDAFLQECLSEQPHLVLKALQELRADLKHPPFTPDELLAALQRAELPGFAAQLQLLKDKI